ncbi:MAG: YceI family protein [Acidimicrobiales bacterium]|nr:YceI family protein [Acidimicrobiales bacterium]
MRARGPAIRAEWGPTRRGRAGPSRLRKTYPLKWVAVGLAAVTALLIGGPYFYFNVIEGKAPAKLSLPAAKSPVVPGPVSGTWTVAPGSEAGYRVDEVLFGQAHTAVGRTSKVNGRVVISGTEVTSADITVDLASIKSDQGSRDAQFNGFIMKTYDYPTAAFKLTQPIGLGSIPGIAQRVQDTATGDLRMRGVTQPVTFVLSAQRSGSGIDVNAEIPIVFSRWHIPNPSFAVAHVGNTGTLEVLLDLQPGAP